MNLHFKNSYSQQFRNSDNHGKCFKVTNCVENVFVRTAHYLKNSLEAKYLSNSSTTEQKRKFTFEVHHDLKASLFISQNMLLTKKYVFCCIGGMYKNSIRNKFMNRYVCICSYLVF